MKRVIMMLAVISLLVAASPAKNGYEVGDTVADFKLKNVDGKTVSLADYKTAKGFIVIFDCNTCPVSKAYNERIIALNKKYADKGFPVIAINPNTAAGSAAESAEEMARIAKSKGYTFPYLVDETQGVTTAFGATNTPHVYILTKDLKVAYIGAIDNNTRDANAADKHYVEDAVNLMLDGKAVTVNKTKAVGCSIKWKDA